MKNNKYTPCDSGNCPYDATGGMQCRDFCGLGVDESGVDYDVEDYEEEYMGDFIVNVELIDGTEKFISLDVTSIDLEQDEEVVGREIKILIEEQYPEYKGKILQVSN